MHPLVTHSVYKVTRSLSWRDHLHEEFSCNSTHQIGLSEILVMASLLGTFLGELRRKVFGKSIFPAALVEINADHYLEEQKGAGTFSA